MEDYSLYNLENEAEKINRHEFIKLESFYYSLNNLVNKIMTEEKYSQKLKEIINKEKKLWN